MLREPDKPSHRAQYSNRKIIVGSLHLSRVSHKYLLSTRIPTSPRECRRVSTDTTNSHQKIGTSFFTFYSWLPFWCLFVCNIYIRPPDILHWLQNISAQKFNSRLRKDDRRLYCVLCTWGGLKLTSTFIIFLFSQSCTLLTACLYSYKQDNGETNLDWSDRKTRSMCWTAGRKSKGCTSRTVSEEHEPSASHSSSIWLSSIARGIACCSSTEDNGIGSEDLPLLQL